MINTIIIAAWKIVLGLVVPIVFALLLNEIKGRRFKKVVQTIVYLPYFMSWVILGGIFRDMLSPGEGIINQIITAFGGKSIFFLGDNRYFRGTMIVTDIWKNFGYGAIVYLAAIIIVFIIARVKPGRENTYEKLSNPIHFCFPNIPLLGINF